MVRLKKVNKIHIFICLALITANVFFLIPAMVIHILFKLTSYSDFMKPEWTAGEILEYCGSFFSFLGTMGLGLLAIWQNKQMEKKTFEYQNLLRDMQIREKEPVFQFEVIGFHHNGTQIDVSITNLTDNAAMNVHIDDVAVFSNSDKLKCISVKNECKNILAKAVCKITFFDIPYIVSDKCLSFHLFYEDIYKNTKCLDVKICLGNEQDHFGQTEINEVSRDCEVIYEKKTK